MWIFIAQVKRREDAIKRLKMEHVNMQEANSRYEEKVGSDNITDNIHV